MVKILIDLPKNISKALSLYSIKQDINDKRKSIIEILKKYLLK